MIRRRPLFGVAAITAILTVQTLAAPFVVFPKAAELRSPDGRFAVRNADSQHSPSDFVGTFHSLWLVELATGRSRKLCDYVGVAAVAWSGNDFLLVNQYLSNKTSRALVFSPTSSPEPVLLDKRALISALSPSLRDTLRENDRVFIEASRMEGDTLFFSVWGYGAHDANGFHWACQCDWQSGSVTCSEKHRSR